VEFFGLIIWPVTALPFIFQEAVSLCGKHKRYLR